MRKLILVSAVFSLTIGSAQEDSKDKLVIEKGTWLLNGNLSFSYSDSDNDDSQSSFNKFERLSFSLSPSIGYTFSENWITGLGIGYGRSKFEDSSQFNDSNFDASENTSRSVFVAPFLRRYFGTGKNLSIFLQGECSYTKTWYNYEQNNSPDFSEESHRILSV